VYRRMRHRGAASASARGGKPRAREGADSKCKFSRWSEVPIEDGIRTEEPHTNRGGGVYRGGGGGGGGVLDWLV